MRHRDPRAGIPVVGVEPSCVSVFRDERPNLLAGDADAERLARQTKTLCELLIETPGWRPPRLQGEAVPQLHCHSKSVLNAEPLGPEPPPEPAAPDRRALAVTAGVVFVTGFAASWLLRGNRSRVW